LEDLDAEVNINSAWKTSRENIKIQPKRFYDIMNSRSISHGFMNDVQIITSKEMSIISVITGSKGNKWA
jgi:hypothetical protein